MNEWALAWMTGLVESKAEAVREFEVHAFAEDHLGGVLKLCEAEGWPSLPACPERALRVLSAPGVTTCVALAEGRVAGFAQLLSDGEIQSYLAQVLVSPDFRRRGMARALVLACAEKAGGSRVDLLAADTSRNFYESFSLSAMPDYRIYPKRANASNSSTAG